MLHRVERVMRKHSLLCRVLLRVRPPDKAAAALAAEGAAIYEELGLEAVMERRFLKSLFLLLRRQPTSSSGVHVSTKQRTSAAGMCLTRSSTRPFAQT